MKKTAQRRREGGGEMPFYCSEGELSLRDKLMTAVVDSNLSYQEAISALNYVRTVLNDKANNLLDGVSIQEVAKKERFNR